jgi:hypothetical protein
MSRSPPSGAAVDCCAIFASFPVKTTKSAPRSVVAGFCVLSHAAAGSTFFRCQVVGASAHAAILRPRQGALCSRCRHSWETLVRLIRASQRRLVLSGRAHRGGRGDSLDPSVSGRARTFSHSLRGALESRLPMPRKSFGGVLLFHVKQRQKAARRFAPTVRRSPPAPNKRVAARIKHGYDIGLRTTVSQADGSTLPAIPRAHATPRCRQGRGAGADTCFT